MKQHRTNARKASGFTLITALAFTLVVGTVLAGVGTVAMSHFSRANVEGDYANAIALADGGLNYEIGSISRGIQSGAGTGNIAGGASQIASPFVGSIPGVSGSFSVYVRQWGTGCNGGDWSGVGDLCVVSTGTVNGMSRTVQIRGRGESFFNDYSIYATGITGATFNGLGKSDKDGIQGNMGSNGNVTLHGAIGSDAIKGTLYLNGPNATSPGPGGNVAHNDSAVSFPTVSQVASALFPGGLTYLQTHNNNANIMMLKSTDPTLSSEPTITGLTLADVQSKMTTAGYTTLSRTLSTSPLTVTKDTSPLDSSNNGTRFADTTAGQGAQNAKVLFFPPGDYYFSDFSPNTTLVMLTHLGLVRLWIDSSSTSGDSFLHLVVLDTDTTTATFRMFYNKCATISMHGNSAWHGSVYAVKAGCSNGKPSVDLSGSNLWYGGLIANSFTIGGGSKVIFPNNGGGNSLDPAPWIGFQDAWKEIKTTNDANHTVFSDGTNN